MSTALGWNVSFWSPSKLPYQMLDVVNVQLHGNASLKAPVSLKRLQVVLSSLLPACLIPASKCQAAIA